MKDKVIEGIFWVAGLLTGWGIGEWIVRVIGL